MRQGAVRKLRWRDIDRDPKIARPARRILARLAQRPIAYAADQAGFFRDGNKNGRRYWSLGRMVPAHQGLYPSDAVGLAVHQGLVDQSKLVPDECVPEMLLKGTLLLSGGQQFGQEELGAATAVRLRGVKSQIRIAHQTHA